MIATAELIEKPTAEDISMQAYFLWEQNGRPHGRDEEFWLEAEQKLLIQMEQRVAQLQPKPKTPSSRLTSAAKTTKTKASAPRTKKATAAKTEKPASKAAKPATKPKKTAGTVKKTTAVAKKTTKKAAPKTKTAAKAKKTKS